jgi:predicted tellurium resistance membrane protein TerC
MDRIAGLPGLSFDASAWAALVTLTVMEVVLGVDNLVFVAVLSNTLPATIRAKARTIGLVLALGFRIALLSTLVLLTHLTQPLAHAFGRGFSARDLILIAGGLFLLWKATTEIRGQVDPAEKEAAESKPRRAGPGAFAWAIVQILMLDLVFSVDSILTAVGMTDRLPVMIVAVILAVGLMLVASGPLAAFIRKNPSVVMLALGFLLMIGAVLIADGFGEHIPRPYIYAAMAFAAFVEALNMLARRKGPRAGE